MFKRVLERRWRRNWLRIVVSCGHSY